MSQINDAILAATGGPTVPDGLLSFYQSLGATSGQLNDAEYEFLLSQGVSPAHINDMWFTYLRAKGYTGALDDMLAAWWGAGAPVGPSVEFHVDFTTGSAQPVIDTVLALPFNAYPEQRILGPTFTRASAAWHTQTDGSIVQVGAGELRFKGMLRTVLVDPGVAPYYHGAMVPNVKYVPQISSSEGALLEPGRTNVMLSNTNPANATYWTSANVNATLQPSGSPTGEGSVAFNVLTNTNLAYVQQVVTSVDWSTTPGCLSFYFKPLVGWSIVRGFMSDGVASTQNVDFDTTTGIATPLAGGQGTNVRASMQLFANGWWRCQMSCNLPSSVAEFADIAQTIGVAGDSAVIWGVQVESGVDATSVLLTDASAVPRPEELLSYAEGTPYAGPASVYVEGIVTPYATGYTPAFCMLATLVDFQNGYTLAAPGSNTFTARAQVVSAGTVIFESTSFGTLVANQGYKLAVAYASGSARAALNGVLSPAGSNAAAPPSVGFAHIASRPLTLRPFSLVCRKVQFYHARLSDAQLIAATTL